MNSMCVNDKVTKRKEKYDLSLCSKVVTTTTTNLSGANSDTYIKRVFIRPVLIQYVSCTVLGTAAGNRGRRNVGRVWNDIWDLGHHTRQRSHQSL